jgi:HAD superfamily hydrolase (TIGR01484 family)
VPIRALATDYDGTLASRGEVSETTLDALTRLKASGRKLLMITGRELPDLRRVFPQLGLFDAVVAENGALLYRPELDEELPLAPAPPAAFLDELRRRQVDPLAVGRSIVATLRTHEESVVAAIEALELPWRIIFNNESLMCLPRGVDKASGLVAGLHALGLTPADALGVGDAENDHPFLAACGLSAAVANALPALKADVDIVTEGEEGAGVTWLIGGLLDGALAAVAKPRASPPVASGPVPRPA